MITSKNEVFIRLQHEGAGDEIKIWWGMCTG